MSRQGLFACGRQGIEIIGLFQSASGIGEAARLCARQLADAGCKVRCISMERAFRKFPEIDWAFDNTAAAHDIGCRIFHLNPPMMPPVVLSMGLKAFKSTYNIGALAWELEEIPSEWVRALRYMNAFACPSQFTAATIGKYTNKPVITVPHPVPVGVVETGMRRKLGIPDNAFLVSSIFSFGSALERKNPYGTVRAFTQAFGEADNAHLILKTNAGGDCADKRCFLEAIKAHRNIRLIDDLWPRAEVLGLIKESDVYLSLHRSEGFGLTIAEAMRLGTPTVVTNWSGNTDFCNVNNSFLIDYEMLAVQSQHPEFAALGSLQWADPKSEHAAEVLRSIHEKREVARNKARQCLQNSNRYFSDHNYIRALDSLKTGSDREVEINIPARRLFNFWMGQAT